MTGNGGSKLGLGARRDRWKRGRIDRPPDRGGSEGERGKRQSNFEVSRLGIRHLLMPLIEAKVVNIGY